MTPRVIVVGGGLAGLTAAIRAGDDGAEVTLLERAPRLGGATWSFTNGGLSYDNGQHVFLRCCTAYRAFLDRIGSAGDVTLQPRMDVPVHRPGGRVSRLHRVGLPAPLHLGPALARYRHLSLRQRLRAAMTALALRRLDLDDRSLDDQSFGEWLAGRGADRWEQSALWDLVCRPTANVSAGEASLLLAAKVFKTGLLDTGDAGDIGWSNVPLRRLHGDRAGSALATLGAEVRLGSRVTAVSSDSRLGPAVAVDDENLTADAVVVAVPHDAAAELLPAGSFPHQDAISSLGRSPIVNIHLLYDRPVIDVPFLAGVGSPVQFVFDRTTSAGAAPGQQCLAISLSAADEYLPRSRAELIEEFTAEMARLLPAAASATVLSAMVTREVAATFRGAPGTARLRPRPQTELAGVFLAGAWTDTGWPATMEGAVRSGLDAAAAVRRHTTSRQTPEVAA